MKTVKVTLNPKNNQIFTKNEKPGKDGKEYGFIRLEETEGRIDWSSGIARAQSPRSVLKTFLVSDWEKVKHQLVAGTEIPGHIISIQSTERVGNEAQMTAGEGGAPLTFKGQPVYRTTVFDPTGKLEDVKMPYFDQSKVKTPTHQGAGAEDFE